MSTDLASLIDSASKNAPDAQPNFGSGGGPFPPDGDHDVIVTNFTIAPDEFPYTNSGGNRVKVSGLKFVFDFQKFGSNPTVPDEHVPDSWQYALRIPGVVVTDANDGSNTNIRIQKEALLGFLNVLGGANDVNDLKSAVNIAQTAFNAATSKGTPIVIKVRCTTRTSPGKVDAKTGQTKTYTNRDARAVELLSGAN